MSMVAITTEASVSEPRPKLVVTVYNLLKQLIFTVLTAGITGVGLTIQFFMIYVFAMPYARRHAFRAFWITHLTYPLFYIQTILHGAGRLIQPPFFYYFFLGPLLLFVADQLISVSRRKIEITVIKAELLPSGELYSNH